MGRSSLAAIALLLGAVLAHAGPLHKAAGAGDVDEVRRLLAEGEDIGEMEPLGTPLHWAAMKGQLEVAEVLVAEGAKVDEPAGKLRFTPLHMAALGGSSDVAAFLVASGAEIDARNARGNTPLHLAASSGHIAVAETLVASGADLNAPNNVDDTPSLCGRSRSLRHRGPADRARRIGTASGPDHRPARRRRSREGARPVPRMHALPHDRPERSTRCGAESGAESVGCSRTGKGELRSVFLFSPRSPGSGAFGATRNSTRFSRTPRDLRRAREWGMSRA